MNHVHNENIIILASSHYYYELGETRCSGMDNTRDNRHNSFSAAINRSDMKMTKLSVFDQIKADVDDSIHAMKKDTQKKYDISFEEASDMVNQSITELYDDDY